MGNCCEDRKLEGEAPSLGGGDCEDFEAHGGDRSLEVDLAGNESRGADLGREEGEEGWLRAQGAEGESDNLKLERVDSESCEAKLKDERCEGSIGNNISVDVVNDCGVRADDMECPGLMGFEEETGHHGSEQVADVGVLEKDPAGCEADEAFNPQNGVTDYVPPTDNENGHVKLVRLPGNAEERCRGILGSGRTGDVGISLEEGFDHRQLQPASTDGDVADRRLAVVEVMKNRASVDSGSVLGDMVLRSKDNRLGYTGSLGDEEASEGFGLAQKSEVDALQPVIDEKHDRFPGSSPSRKLRGNCFLSSACEKVCVSRNINTDYTHQSLEVGNIDIVVSVDNGTERRESVSGRKEGEEELIGVVGTEEEIGHLGSKEASTFEASNSITEEEHDEFPGLSPLRTLGGGDFACSVFGIGSEVGFLSAGVFDTERVRHGCEDSELLVSSGLVTDYPLAKMNRPSRRTDGHCYTLDASHNCEEPCTEKRCKELHCFKAEKVHFKQCSLNTLCSNVVIEDGKEFCLSIDRSLPLQYLGSQKEHCEDNISGHYHKEISGEEEVNHSMQCSPEEVAPCVTSKGLALRKPSNLCMSAENFFWTLSSSSGFQGTEADSFIGTSSCCSNVNSSHGEAYRDSKSSPTIVLRRSNPKRGASLRSNLADGNCNQLGRTRNSKRNGKKAVDVNSTFLLNTIKISDKLKRKRSRPHRRSRPSVWAPIENLIKIFEKNVKLATYGTDKVHVQNKRPKKGRSMAESKRQPKSWKDGNFQVLPAKDSAMPDQPVFPVVIGLPTSDCLTNIGNFNEVESEHKLSGDELAAAVKALKRDRQLGDKDMDSSLTQDASVEVGECAGVSSQMAPDMLLETVRDRNSLDSGTSPDSDVYHPVLDVGIMTSEGNHLADQAIETKNVSIAAIDSASLANQFCGMDQKELVLESVSEDGEPAAVSTFYRAYEPTSFPPLNLCAKTKKGKMDEQLRQQPCLLEDLSIAEGSHVPDDLNKAKKPPRSGKSKQKKRDNYKKNQICSDFIKKTTQKGSKCESSTPEFCVSETTELQRFKESMEVQNCLDKQVLTGQEARSSQSEAFRRTAKAKGQKLLCGSKSGGSKGRTHCEQTAGRRRQNAHRKMGISVQNSVKLCSAEEVNRTGDLSVEASDHICCSSGTVKPTCSVSTQQNYKTTAGSKAPSEDTSSLVTTPVGDLLASNESKAILEQPLRPQVAWVLCDDCEKWRCISVELANTLEETKCKWTCKDNTDKAFADCSIPQEKTNAQINAELGISDEEDPSAVKANNNDVESLKLADVATSQRASWIPIKSNLFLHRNRKTQTIDEIMVCHCKRLGDGHRGCGDQCLNRMLNIECVKGTCPCGDLCSNQRFQKRKYAKFKWFRCGKKGYGLQLQENASQGQFLIEYVGEVLDLATYEARQRCYAARGQKHFYFMTLNGGEVIDACAKGNLGRFINHSCEPNCRTEKWMVNGEVCIGLFAIRDIKKGEEVTFDYNYVRVVGAAAKKCVCGSSECRGYIGGDPLNSEIIVQGDSDEDDIEPMMMRENCTRGLNLNDSMSKAIDGKHKERSVERKDIIGTSPHAMSDHEVCLENSKDIYRTVPEVNQLNISLQTVDCIQSGDTVSGPVSGILPLGDSVQNLNIVQSEENVCKATLDIQKQEISVPASSSTDEVPSDSVLSSKKSMANLYEERPNTAKPRSVTKASEPRNTIKRGRPSVKNLVSHKTKILTPSTSHSEGVEGKLNELLDRDGGISKKKDATRGYLKLLFVTAAEGDVRGYASQSTRDLSLILDAILKTKSRKVLVDIINKNGLQMLHNIMKQNRHYFNRIPIIRKLLKVLEFLALTGILTPELINKDPPCSGMESFKESILKLANHNDKQVHKTAREFRDKWIPRNIKRVEPSDRDGGQFDRQLPFRSWIQSSKFKCQQVHAARDTDAIVINAADHPLASPGELETLRETSSHSQQMSISTPPTDSSLASGTNPRKRKSRWDQPSDITSADCSSENQIWEGGPKFMKCTLPPFEEVAQPEVSKQMCGFERDGSFCGEVASQDLMQLDHEKPGFIDKGPPGFIDDERPPGFFDDERPSGSIDGERPPGFFEDEKPSGFVDDGPPGFIADERPPGFVDEKGPPGFVDDERPPGFVDENGPPGFESLQKNHNPQFSSETDLVAGEVFTGHAQEIYLSHMPMAYGIPVGLMQQLGDPESGGSPDKQNWRVAAGIPFYPFPPLPPYPRGQPNPREERRQALPASGPELAIPSTSGGMLADTVETGSRNPRFNGRLRWPSNDCGRRYLRPQRPNNRRFDRCWPHWPPQRFGRGFRSDMRVGPNNIEQGNTRRDFPGGFCPSDGVHNYDDMCSSFQQQHD